MLVFCRECVFFKRNAGQDAGRCRRRAPRPTWQDDDRGSRPVWPWVREDEGCGDGEETPRPTTETR